VLSHGVPITELPLTPPAISVIEFPSQITLAGGAIVNDGGVLFITTLVVAGVEEQPFKVAVNV
jgi:hypothetical protein